MIAKQQRYWDWLMALAEITDPEQPYTRRSFSERFLQGRQWLREQMEQLGLEVRVDHAGNLIGALQGTEPELGVIMTGSHSDSVPRGGRFDGIAGVIAGLELVASWRERGYKPRHTIEMVDFLAEEPSEWGISCVGSRGITGFMGETLQSTPHPKSGELLKDAIVRMGGKPESLEKRTDIKAFFELHIEQGAVLEHEQVTIGVVSSIVGILRLAITFKGQAAHAGTTPMHIRRDALTAATETAYKASQLANDMAREGLDKATSYFTATCGQVFVTPNASNVVPGQVQLVFDIRSDRKESMEYFATCLHSIATQAAAQARVELIAFERMTDTYPMQCDSTLMRYIAESAQAQGFSHKVMPSGAGHDAAFMCYVAPAAMVFVPSVEGKSHCPEEYTSPEDLTAGVSVLIAAIERCDQATEGYKL